MAGVPASVVSRAQVISKDFFASFKDKLNARRRSTLPLMAHGDFAYLMKVALNKDGVDDGTGLEFGQEHVQGQGQGPRKASLKEQMGMIRACIGKYEIA